MAKCEDVSKLSGDKLLEHFACEGGTARPDDYMGMSTPSQHGKGLRRLQDRDNDGQ